MDWNDDKKVGGLKWSLLSKAKTPLDSVPGANRNNFEEMKIVKECDMPEEYYAKKFNENKTSILR